MSRILIFGISGFLGAEIAKRLGGQELLGLSSAQCDLSAEGARSKVASLVRPDDTIIFVSALTPDRGRDVRTLMRNLTMGEAIAGALEEKGCRHLLYVSSDAVYGERSSLVSEETPVDGESFHGTMHVVRERILRDVCKRVGIPFLVLRPTALYGRGDTHNSYGPNRFMRSAEKEGVIALTGEGEERRDHLYGEDFARIVERSVKEQIVGTVNVATGVSRSFGEVAAVVQRLASRTVQLDKRPRTQGVTHRHFDITALIKFFPGFTFTSLEDGIAASLGRIKH